MSTKPTITRRDLSLLEAQAGLQARDHAAAQGGDPAQIAALMRAANGEAPAPGEHQYKVGGVPLSGMTLAVTLAVSALRAAYAPMTVQPPEVLTTARMVYLFHNPYRAYELLSPVPDLVGLDAEAMDLVGEWGESELTAFAAHLAACAKRNPNAATTEEEAPLGKRLKTAQTLKTARPRRSLGG
jgi:hypothetical protein